MIEMAILIAKNDELLIKEAPLPQSIQFFENQRYISVKQTAEYLGISERTIYDQIAPKARKPFPVKPRRIGGSVRFDIIEIDKYMKAA